MTHGFPYRIQGLGYRVPKPLNPKPESSQSRRDPEQNAQESSGDFEGPSTEARWYVGMIHDLGLGFRGGPVRLPPSQS